MKNLFVQHYINKVKQVENLIEEENKRHEETLNKLNNELLSSKKTLFKVLKSFDLLNDYIDKFKDSLFKDI